MPANFLIVCGGAGRGILQQFDALGFAGALQIDMQHELLPPNQHARILQVGLPIGYGAHTFDGPAIMVDYLQRLEAQWHTHHTQAAHTGDMQACHMDECPDYRHQRNHARVVMNAHPPAQLRAGTHAPLMMRAYVTQPRVTHTIAQALERLRHWIPATEQNVTVWLVASTCGVTGNGIVHHVADLVKQVFGDLSLLIKFIRIGALSYQSISRLATVSTFWSVLTDYGYRKRHERYVIELTGRGIGYWTTLEFYYIDLPDTNTNTRQRESLVQSAFVTFVNPTINVEFVRLLNQLVRVVMARVGEWGRGFDQNMEYKLTLGQLNQKLKELLQPSEAAVISKISSTNVTAPIDLMSQDNGTLYAALAQSAAMQQQLVGLARLQNDLNAVNSLAALKSHPLWSKMQQLVMLIFDEETQNTLRRQVQLSITINNETEQLNFSGEGNDADYYIGSEEHIKLIRLAQYAKVQAKHFLLGDRDSTGYVMTELREAWDGLIPIGPVRSPGYGRLFGQLFATDEQRRKAFVGGITRFLQAYFRVARWLEIADEADAVIGHARASFRNMELVVDQEYRRIGTNEDYEYTLCAALDTVMQGGQTWAQQLLNATRHDIGQAIRTGTFRTEIERGAIDEVTLLSAPDDSTAWVQELLQLLIRDISEIIQSGEFRKTVEMGAIGLTEDGLKYVMEMPARASWDQIVDQLNTNVGSNNSVWWQGIEQPRLWGGPHSDWVSFDYRIFPKLPSNVFASLHRANQAWGPTNARHSPSYMDVNSPALGLKVYAVQCAVPKGDSSSYIDWIRELIGHPAMRDALNSRHPQYATGAGKFDLNNYISTQCTHSIGLPIGVTPGLMNDDPAIKDIMTIMADYLVIDQS